MQANERAAPTEAEATRARIPNALMSLGVRHPRGVLLVWLLLGLAGLPGVLALRIDTSTDSVLDRHHPDWEVYQASQDRFGGDEIIAIALRGERPYDPAVIDRVEALTDRLQALEGIRRVDSIATFPTIRVDEQQTLDLRPLLAGAPDAPDARSRYVEERVAGDRIAPRSLVSEDGRVFALNVVLERGVEARHAELLSQLHALVDPIGGVLSGVPTFRVAANDRTGAEILLFAPLTGGLIALFLVAMFRAPIVVLVGAAPGVIGSWILIAMMGYLGVPLSITTMVLPSIILALGCAYAMHLLSAGSGSLGGPALERALARVTLPVALSGLTTAVGFVSITVVRIDAVRATGGFGALGVLVVTAVSLTLLPAALQLRPLPRRPPRGFSWVRHWLGPWLVSRTAAHGRAILVGWVALAVLLSVGLSRIEVETDATAWLPHGHPVRDAYEDIRRSLSGISPINVVVEAPDGGSAVAPETLAAIDGLSSHLDSLEAVGKSISIADPLRQINGGFRGDPSQPLPESRAQAEEYLLLLGSVEAIRDLISLDQGSANVQLRVDDNASTPLLEVAAEAKTWWAAHGPPDHAVVATGIMYEFARAENEIAYGQLRGLALALAVISLILFAIFRRPRIAFVALVPNAVPLVIIFGSMGLAGIPLDAGTVLIGGLALGVAVDDTIHITSGFCERLERGEAPREALLVTYARVLPAIVATSVMIGAAFLVLGLSEFTITRNLGLLTAGIMVLCLLADVSLLAALLLRVPLAESADTIAQQETDEDDPGEPPSMRTATARGANPLEQPERVRMNAPPGGRPSTTP